MNKFSRWQIGLIIGVGVIVIGLAVSLSIVLTQRGPESETAPPSREEAAPLGAPAPSQPISEPSEQVELEEIRLQGIYLRPGVKEGRYYIQVEKVLAGPTPCREDGLLIVVEPSHGQRYILHTNSRLEISGLYKLTETSCQVLLTEPEHGMKLFLQPSPQPEEERPREPQSETPAAEQAVAVRVQGRFTDIRGDTYFLIVSQVLQGQVPCDQLSVIVAAPTVYLDQVNFRDEYEIYGLYNPSPTVAPCRLTLSEPAHYIRSLRSTPRPPNPRPVTPTPEPHMPFFFSGGISLLQPLTIFKGSAGLTLTPQIRGLVSVGVGQGEITKRVERTGERIPVELEVIALEIALMYQVAEKIYIGGSGGLLMLSGDYELPYPIEGSTSFRQSLPTAGIVVGFDLGYVMVTGGVSVILGGGS
jgi:hypothetical protein